MCRRKKMIKFFPDPTAFYYFYFHSEIITKKKETKNELCWFGMRDTKARKIGNACIFKFRFSVHENQHTHTQKKKLSKRNSCQKGFGLNIKIKF